MKVLLLFWVVCSGADCEYTPAETLLFETEQDCIAARDAWGSMINHSATCVDPKDYDG